MDQISEAEQPKNTHLPFVPLNLYQAMVYRQNSKTGTMKENVYKTLCHLGLIHLSAVQQDSDVQEIVTNNSVLFPICINRIAWHTLF